MSSLHVSLDPDIKTKLKNFAKKRSKPMASIINYALDNLFSQEQESDPKKYAALKVIIDRKFSIPKAFSLNSFYIVLYMNANHYPNKSAKVYWGPIVYLSEVDKTHKEIFIEVKEELKRELDGGK